MYSYMLLRMIAGSWRKISVNLLLKSLLYDVPKRSFYNIKKFLMWFPLKFISKFLWDLYSIFFSSFCEILYQKLRWVSNVSNVWQYGACIVRIYCTICRKLPIPFFPSLFQLYRQHLKIIVYVYGFFPALKEILHEIKNDVKFLTTFWIVPSSAPFLYIFVTCDILLFIAIWYYGV